VSIIHSLKTKAGNTSEIPSIVYKRASHALAPPIALLFNKSIECHTFPDILKKARVTPVHKGGNPADINNYRPISNLPILSKIFEKIIYKQLYSYLVKFDILSPCQFGFRSQKSTNDAIISLLDIIYSALDKNEFPIGLFIDLRKAFDTVNHNYLLLKLQHYGIRGLALDYIRSYLSDRHQYVTINDTTSSTLPITVGVPQGSILGPLLFLIYINDLPNVSNILKPILFADDTTLIYSNLNPHTLNNVVNNELKKVHLWMSTNKLTLNIEKTYYILFGSKSSNAIQLQIDNINISNKDDGKFLGLFLDKRLNFSTHIQHITKKVSKTVGILSKIRYYVPNSALLSLYYALIYPYLNYGICAWGSTTANHLKPIITQQKSAIRIITNSAFRQHSAPLFKSLNLLNINSLHTFSCVNYIYKTLFLNANHALKLSLDRCNRTHYHHTRNKYLFDIPRVKLNLCKHSMQIKGPSLWNSLPSELKNCKTFALFKSKTKKYLTSSS
jgi:hypothetical protein